MLTWQLKIEQERIEIARIGRRDDDRLIARLLLDPFRRRGQIGTIDFAHIRSIGPHEEVIADGQYAGEDNQATAVKTKRRTVLLMFARRLLRRS